MAFTTAQRAIEKLQKFGILKAVSDPKRHRVYCAKAILGILEELVQLHAGTGVTPRPQEIRVALRVSRQGALDLPKLLLEVKPVRRLGTEKSGRHALA